MLVIHKNGGFSHSYPQFPTYPHFISLYIPLSISDKIALKPLKGRFFSTINPQPTKKQLF